MPAIPTIKYAHGVIFDPAAVPFIERNEFMQKVCSTSLSVQDIPIEQRILQAWKERLANIGGDKKIEVDPALARMARDYSRYLKEGARLPKFTRWCAGMFPNNAELNGKLAMFGQAKSQAGEYVFSAKLVDILRAGVSKHFWSCFTATSTGGPSLLKIASEAPGIAVVYKQHEDGTMSGRAWLYHAKRDGEDVVVISNPYGTMDVTAIARELKARGFTVCTASRYAGGANQTVIKYQDVGGRFYNDIDLWCDPARATLIQ